jgi:hypothetical protein
VRPPPPVLGTAQVASGLTGVAPVCVCRCGCCLDKETRKDRQANGPRGLLQGSLQEPFHEPTDMQPTDMHRMSVSMPPATAGTIEGAAGAQAVNQHGERATLGTDAGLHARDRRGEWAPPVIELPQCLIGPCRQI